MARQIVTRPLRSKQTHQTDYEYPHFLSLFFRAGSRFDEETDRIFFRQGDAWFLVPWDGGEIVEVDPDASRAERRRAERANRKKRR